MYIIDSFIKMYIYIALPPGKLLCEVKLIMLKKIVKTA